MNKPKNPNRRQFLADGGKFLATLPFLPSLFSSEAEAGGVVRPRLITIFTHNGQRQEYWAPLQAANVPFAGGSEIALSTFATTGISPILGPAFAPYLSQMSMIQGLDHVVSLGHNSQAILGHYSTLTPFPTIDQVLSKSTKFYGGTTPIINNLNYGESFSFGYSGTNFVQMPTFTDIQGSYQRIFGLGQPAVLQKHASIVDKTLAMYAKASKNSALSATDKQLLDSQGTLVSELRNRLNTIQPLTCSVPASPAQPAGNEDFLLAAVDMVVASFLCGATQVSSIGINDPSPVDTGQGWHEPSHTPEVPGAHVPTSLTINKWIAEKFVLRLMQKMDSIVEANGKSMLYNSVIYWGNEMSYGNGHSAQNLPVILAGSAGGKLRTGYLYDYRQMDQPDIAADNAGSTSKVGRPYNQFLVTLLQAMGLSPADYEMNGIKGYGVNQSGTAETNNHYTKFMTGIGTPLPRLYIG